MLINRNQVYLAFFQRNRSIQGYYRYVYENDLDFIALSSSVTLFLCHACFFIDLLLVLCLKTCLKNILLFRCHPRTLRDPRVRLLQLQLGERAHQSQRHRTLLWWKGQTEALLRHVEECLWHCGGGQARMLAGWCQLLRQVCGCYTIKKSNP